MLQDGRWNAIRRQCSTVERAVSAVRRLGLRCHVQHLTTCAASAECLYLPEPPSPHWQQWGRGGSWTRWPLRALPSPNLGCCDPKAHVAGLQDTHGRVVGNHLEKEAVKIFKCQTVQFIFGPGDNEEPLRFLEKNDMGRTTFQENHSGSCVEGET